MQFCDAEVVVLPRRIPANLCLAGPALGVKECNDTKAAAKPSAWSAGPLATQRRGSFLRDDHLLSEAQAEQISTAEEVGREGYSGFAAVKDGFLALLFQNAPRPKPTQLRH